MSYHPFSAGKISNHQNWLMEIVFTKSGEITIDDMLEISQFRQTNLGDNPYCTLIDAQQDFLVFDTQSKKFTATDPAILRLRVAEAILVQNLGQQIGASLYLRLFKSKSNRRVFMNRESAIEWLEKRYKKAIQKEASLQ